MLKGYGAVILDGAWLTLQLALSSMALAIVLGLIGVSMRLSPVRWLAWLWLSLLFLFPWLLCLALLA